MDYLDKSHNYFRTYKAFSTVVFDILKCFYKTILAKPSFKGTEEIIMALENPIGFLIITKIVPVTYKKHMFGSNTQGLSFMWKAT